MNFVFKMLKLIFPSCLIRQGFFLKLETEKYIVKKEKDAKASINSYYNHFTLKNAKIFNT